MENLIKIQNELKAPKNQFNSFGKYHYRNCEDILEALKPILLKYNATLTITDEVKELAGVIFIEATATIKCDKEEVSARASAGVDINKKGMDVSQTFGSSSSYARKYALNGLFLIDDTKDPDSKENSGKENKEPLVPNMLPKDNSTTLRSIQMRIDKIGSIDELNAYWRELPADQKELVKGIFSKRKEMLTIPA